ncbi:hypothetical protein ZIOFF_057321 [Zingiber officinale]|uniref:Protein kinase domain-containing protein n=1 Tax=Zingiber officinale TaxID=94328 RepID=A0A8J5KBP6_ZINOF|nr:hypothetical protein ZIOFF_057321 [Zingiber officinale]
MAWAKVLLVVFALGTTWGSVASTGAQQIKTTSTKNRTFTLPSNCPTSCGNISIQYPFGIGDGCYLPGFNLTCRKQNNRTVSAQLFMGDGTLEVTGITLYSGYVSFKLPVISMGVSQSSITTPLIDLKNYHNFNFWATDNYLFVSGCNVNASVVDLANNNTIIYNCSTFCLDVSPDLSPFVIRHQKCRVRIGNELPDRVFLGVRLTRFNQTRLHLTNATPVSAYMSSSIGSLESKLSWYMDDHSSCTEAMNDTGTYACISSNGECTDALSVDRDVTVGYYCRCSGGTEGNPYLTDGCKGSSTDVTVANIYPANNCTRKCGSVDIPFPFGLDNESDCYRDSLFALVCNQTTSPPVLQYQDKNVSKVGVERGELYLMEVRNSSEGLTLTEGHYVYSWLIPHHSCENARMNKSLFACVSEHVECRNLKDSKGDQLGYRCGCEKGYTGNPYIMNGCQDINECDTPEKYICKGICKNTEGSYNCTCQPGTYGDPMIGGCIPYTKKRTVMLDDNLVAKVSDFGASRFIPLDQNYVVTAVQGTFGYLDPEYYQTSELTEKSDVYSFGVILLELLTGKAPIHKNEHGDEVNLSKQFLQAMRENHALDLVEDHVLKEGKKEELLEIIQMIEMCLRLKGEERPTMKEVEYKLQGLRRIRMMKKRLSSFAEDNETTENNLSDAFDPSTELVDQRNQGTSTSYSSEKDLMYQQPNSPR